MQAGRWSSGIDNEFLTCAGVSGARWAVRTLARFVVTQDPFSGRSVRKRCGYGWQTLCSRQRGHPIERSDEPWTHRTGRSPPVSNRERAKCT